MVQKQVLDRYPDLDIRVYCLWLPVLRRYTPDEISRALPKVMQRLPDRRAVHYWDGSQAVGRDFRQRILPTYWEGPVVWATFVLFDREGTWQEAPDHVIEWGRPIGYEIEALKRLVETIHPPSPFW